MNIREEHKPNIVTEQGEKVHSMLSCDMEECKIKQIRYENLDLTNVSITRNNGQGGWDTFPNPDKRLRAECEKQLNTAWAMKEKSRDIDLAPCPNGCKCAVDPDDPTRWKKTKSTLRVVFMHDGDQFRAEAMFDVNARRILGECVVATHEVSIATPSKTNSS